MDVRLQAITAAQSADDAFYLVRHSAVCDLDVAHVSATLQKYARERNPTGALRAWRFMISRQIRPDALAFATMAAICNHQGLYLDAVDWAFMRMPTLPDEWQTTVDPSSGLRYYWNVAVNAGQAQWEQPPGTLIYENPMNKSNYQEAILAASGLRQPDTAIAWMRDAQDREDQDSDIADDRIWADVTTYTAVIRALLASQRISEADRLFSEMKERANDLPDELSPMLSPDDVAYTALMQGWAAGGRLDKAKELKTEMLDMGFRCDSSSLRIE